MDSFKEELDAALPASDDEKHDEELLIALTLKKIEVYRIIFVKFSIDVKQVGSGAILPKIPVLYLAF